MEPIQDGLETNPEFNDDTIKELSNGKEEEDGVHE